MKLALETRSPMDALADVLVLGRYAAPTRPAAELVALDKKLDGLLSTVLGTEKFDGKAGQVAQSGAGLRAEGLEGAAAGAARAEVLAAEMVEQELEYTCLGRCHLGQGIGA